MSDEDTGREDQGGDDTGREDDDKGTGGAGGEGGQGDDKGTGDDKGKGDKGKTWTPPTEAEWRATQDKLKKANGQAQAHRKEADELKRKGETDQEAAVRTAREEATAEVTKTWKPRYVRQAAKAELAAAGLTGSPDRLLKLIDPDTCEVDDDGDVTGLDAQIRDLKKDYPELFTARRGGGRIDAGDKGGSGGQPRDGLSDTSRRLLNQMGR